MSDLLEELTVMLTTMWWLQNLEETVNKKKECERLM
jgi:hypothetical protein